jgi:chromosomal replication initiator protein
MSEPVQNQPEDAPQPSALGPAAEALRLARLWEEIQTVLQGYIQREQFDTWFRRAALRSLDEQAITLAVQNNFSRYFINNYYSDVLARAVLEVVGKPREVRFEVDPDLTTGPRLLPSAAGQVESDTRVGGGEAHAPAAALLTPPAWAPGQANGAPTARTKGRLLSSSDVGLNEAYRFESFVVGPCNRFAYAAAVGVSEAPGKTYNPFFIHGNVGLGKTHLMQSLCHSLLERDPNVKILYLSCETFVNHFISALENGDLQKFRNKYRNVDVLVVDDIHLLANKERTQEEFFHTFNTLYNAGKQIVLSSDSPPKDIPSLQGRLVSRFKWGLVTEMESPCFETRMAILIRKCKDRGHELPEETAKLLAERIDTNIRELEGAVVKLIGYARLSSQGLSPEVARECLRDLFEQRNFQPTIEDVLRVVTSHFSVKLADLQSRRRTAGIAYARQVGMYLARRVTALSLEEIGGYYGGRDHSTVLYAIQKIARLSKCDAACLEMVRELESRLNTRPT